MFVGGFVFVSYFSQSSEIPDQTSSVIWTSSALFNLLPGNLDRPNLRTSKLSTSFLFMIGRWEAERFFSSFTYLFYWLSENLMPPFRDRTFLAFTYGVLIKQIFRMLTDSAIHLVWGYRFPNCGIVNVLRSLANVSGFFFHRSTSQLVLDIVWHFFRSKERNIFDACYTSWETQIFNETNGNIHLNWTSLVNSQNNQRYLNLYFVALKTLVLNKRLKLGANQSVNDRGKVALRLDSH